jgi:lysophospholipase L1-like esterase
MVTHPAEDADPYCLAPAEAARLLAGAPWRRFASIGDSLAAGTGDPSPGYAPGGWTDRLAGVLRRIHPELAYRNAAAIGATTAVTLAEQVPAVLAFQPDLLHISCGANDIWRRDPDLPATERTLRRIFALAAGTGARLTTFTLGSAFRVPKYPDWSDRVRALNEVIRAVAADHDAVLVDIWPHPVNARPDLLSADRVHFAGAGQAVLASELTRALARTLTSEPAHPRTGEPAHPRPAS